MNKFATLLHTLLLSLLFAGSALAAEKVNINTADAATIDRVLLNIGKSKAEAIVAYRKANGPFRSIDQLASVKGIGLATVERNRDRILVSGGAPAATTAVYATGAGPGVTAFATTAVFATGAPMTPTLPTRAGLTGMFTLLGSQGPAPPRSRR